MKFSTTPANLKPALTTVAKIVPSKASIPILSGILFETAPGGGRNGDKLTLSATDLEQSIKGSVDGVEILQPGKTVIPKRVIDVLSKLPQHNPAIFEIDPDNRRLTIKYGDFSKPSSFTMGCFDAEEFPALPEVEGIRFKMDFDPKKVAFAAADSKEAITIFQAVHFDLEGGYVVATDKKQVAVQKIEVVPDGGKYNVMPSFISKLAPGTELIFGNNMVSAESEGFVYTSRLLDGKYVEYQRLFRSDFATTARIKTADLKDTLERAKLITEYIPLEFSGMAANVSIKEESGTMMEALIADIQGDELKIILSIQYLLNFLKYIPDEVELLLNGPLDPVYITPDESWQGIIFPVGKKNNE